MNSLGIQVLAGNNFKEVSCSKLGSMAIQHYEDTDSRVLYRAGSNIFGNLGSSRTTDPVIPIWTATGVRFDWLKVSTSDEGHTLLLTTSNKLYGTGLNDAGQLGNSMQNAGYDLPTLIDGTADRWLYVNATNKRSYAIVNNGVINNGDLLAWGSGQNSWLGLGAGTSNISTPTLVTSTNTTGWLKLAVGSGANHMLAIAADGSLWSWGSNNHGQLGLGDTSDRTSPTLVDNTNSWIYVAIGKDFTIAVRSDNTVWGCGINDLYQLAQYGDTNDKLSLIRIYVTSSSQKIIVEVAAGETSTVALSNTGELYGWGGNTNGELGQNNTTPVYYAAQISVGSAGQPVLHASMAKQLIAIGVDTQ
jgi:alpha-tubulin suppressor-like RCC1 family protein